MPESAPAACGSEHDPPGYAEWADAEKGISTSAGASIECVLTRDKRGQPWGFRILWEDSPDNSNNIHRVNHVEKGGLAERMLLQVGDCVTAVNSSPTVQMTHTDMVRVLNRSFPTLALSIGRDHPLSAAPTAAHPHATAAGGGSHGGSGSGARCGDGGGAGRPRSRPPPAEPIDVQTSAISVSSMYCTMGQLRVRHLRAVVSDLLSLRDGSRIWHPSDPAVVAAAAAIASGGLGLANLGVTISDMQMVRLASNWKAVAGAPAVVRAVGSNIPWPATNADVSTLVSCQRRRTEALAEHVRAAVRAMADGNSGALPKVAREARAVVHGTVLPLQSHACMAACGQLCMDSRGRRAHLENCGCAWEIVGGVGLAGLGT
jgi:hypothetical protein